jgi:maltose alpha-D-glucosyltransferase/alpha-amylase
LFLHNLSAEPREVGFSLKEGNESECSLVNLLSNDHSEPDDNNRHHVVLEPYGYRWFRVCGLDYILKREAPALK